MVVVNYPLQLQLLRLLLPCGTISCMDILYFLLVKVVEKIVRPILSSVIMGIVCGWYVVSFSFHIRWISYLNKLWIDDRCKSWGWSGLSILLAGRVAGYCQTATFAKVLWWWRMSSLAVLISLSSTILHCPIPPEHNNQSSIVCISIIMAHHSPRIHRLT